MPADELVDPVRYSEWVLILGLALVLGALAWVGWVLFSKRLARWVTDPKPRSRPETPDADLFAPMRAVYLERVGEVERRHGAGELDRRGVHLTLSAVVREFASDRGIDARHMTLRELRELAGTESLARLIESYYRPAFARNAARVADVDTALAGAREVISTW